MIAACRLAALAMAWMGEATGSTNCTRPRSALAAENQRSKVADLRLMLSLGPALGLYLYRGSPAGGRAEAMQLIEALPTPAIARGLDGLVC